MSCESDALLQEIQDTITWLNSVSAIQPESRVNDEGIVFTRYEGGIVNWLWRKFVYGESRLTQTVTMENRYKRIDVLIRRCDDVENAIPIEYLESFLKTLKNSQIGIRNFYESAHYRNDNRVTSKLQTLINPVIELQCKHVEIILQKRKKYKDEKYQN